MKNLDLLQLRVSNMKLNLILQQMIVRDMLSDIKRLEHYLESKEGKQ